MIAKSRRSQLLMTQLLLGAVVGVILALAALGVKILPAHEGSVLQVFLLFGSVVTGGLAIAILVTVAESFRSLGEAELFWSLLPAWLAVGLAVFSASPMALVVAMIWGSAVLITVGRTWQSVEAEGIVIGDSRSWTTPQFIGRHTTC